MGTQRDQKKHKKESMCQRQLDNEGGHVLKKMELQSDKGKEQKSANNLDEFGKKSLQIKAFDSDLIRHRAGKPVELTQTSDRLVPIYQVAKFVVISMAAIEN